MTLAALNTGSYNVVLLLHLLSVILGTGTAFFAQVLTAKYKKSSETPQIAIQALGMVMSPSLLLSGVFGGALVGMSGNVYDFGQLWLVLAGIFWLTAVAASALLYNPSFLTLPDVRKHEPMLSGLLHLSLVVMLVAMVWKPGF
ncbi:MAG: hypothetical protein QF596_02125 [Acidimicrobiales bacterium]|jgi:hypothetical protein|nr:hypothetical protein [Acidimicrobiales bacterium]MDP6299128.1 hypothetical protein [Acidimicrobiales bacterium]HJM28370.1 hypothetical protein [Acidimicrobiales bacterium]HJM96782.1 hypothetical protein [Acidimicrobiales bacterium]|tara:strand:- start:114 stop:542 length:429 start_codon:yes stop_codon:yes gene_type:complete